MMKHHHPAIATLLALAFSVVLPRTIHAQAVGDLRSAGSGTWNALSSWEVFDGNDFVPIAVVPGAGDGLITIRAGHTITANTFLTADHLDTPITFEDFKKIGGTIGAGTMMVFDDSIDMRDVLTRVGEFFAHESCGKCYPCQIGTQRQAEILHRIQHGESRPEDIDTLLELAQVMTDTSICGLGQSAGWAVTDAIKRWPELLGVRSRK